MRGDRVAQRGRRSNPSGRPSVTLLFYKERLGTKSPPHPPQCAHWGTFPQGEGFGGGKSPVGYPIPFRPTDSPGRAAGPAAARKNQRSPPTFPPPTDSPGRARLCRVSPPAGGERKMRSCFDRLRRQKHTSPRVPASPARVGVQLILGGASSQAEHPPPPYAPSRTKRKPSPPLPKFPQKERLVCQNSPP